MLFTVIVPIYKVQLYIKRCVDSILSQTFTDFECIFVNDCTPDESMEILQQILTVYTGRIQFKIINHQKNKGLSEARNSGLRNAKGDFIFFLDSDDEITPNCLESYSKIIFHSDVLIDVIAGSFFPLSQKQQKLKFDYTQLPKQVSFQGEIIKLMLTKIPAMACNKVYRKEFLIRNSLFFTPRILHEDELWNFQIMKKVQFLAINFEPTYLYYIRPNSIMTNNNKVRSFDSSLFIISSCAMNLGNVQIGKQTHYLWNWLCRLRFSKEYALIENRTELLCDLVKSLIKRNLPFISKLYFFTLLLPDLCLKFVISLDYKYRKLYEKFVKLIC